jgi:hypothetical protein
MWDVLPHDYLAGGVFILFLIFTVIVGALAMIVGSVAIGEVPWKFVPHLRRRLRTR